MSSGMDWKLCSRGGVLTCAQHRGEGEAHEGLSAVAAASRRAEAWHEEASTT
jgi:hypothetical protein